MVEIAKSNEDMGQYSLLLRFSAANVMNFYIVTKKLRKNTEKL